MRTVLYLILLVTFSFLHSESFQANRVLEDIVFLADSIGPRPMGSPSEARALQWAVNRFYELGADTVYLMPFTSAESRRGPVITESGVAVGVFKGQKDSLIVVGGHIDSASPYYPGANDNASGTSTVLELARLWSQRTRAYGMVFCAFGGEERGLLGSQNFVKQFADTAKIKLMISTDMANSSGKIELMFETNTHQAPKWLVRDALQIDRESGTGRLFYPTHFSTLNYLSEHGAGSDHMSFLEKNIPAIDFTAGITDSPIHTAQDRAELILPKSLQSYGEIVDGLLQKYQATGIPSEKSDHFVLWAPAGLTFFIPDPFLILIVVLTLLLVVFATIRLFRTRNGDVVDKRQRFTPLKILSGLILVISCAHLGETVLQLVTGYRFHWVTHITAYQTLTLICGAIGFGLSLRLFDKWQLRKDAFYYGLRYLIVVSLFFILSVFGGLRLAIYPALALLLFALAVIIPKPIIKSLLAIAAPFILYRLIFHEEFLFLLYGFVHGATGINSVLKALLFNLALSVIALLLALPLTFALGYASRSVAVVRSMLKTFRKPIVLGVLGLLFTGLSIWLIWQPAYDVARRPLVRVEAKYNLPDSSSTLQIKGSEYFKDVSVHCDSLQTTLNGRFNLQEINQPFHCNWLQLAGLNHRVHLDTVNVTWNIVNLEACDHLILELKAVGDTLHTISTPLPHRLQNGVARFEWRGTVADSAQINARMALKDSSRLVRKISAYYNSIPLPIEVSSQLASVEYLTEIVRTDTLRVAEFSTLPEQIQP